MRTTACVAGLFSFLVACTGASETELFEQPLTTTGTDTTLPSTPPKDTPKPGPTEDPKPDPPKNPDPPKPTCAAETEPNNSQGAATVFTSCVSGKLGQNDVDHVQVKVPATAKAMVIKSSETGGRIQYRLTGNGFFGVNETWTDSGDFFFNDTATTEIYTFQMRPSGGNGERTWKIEVTFE